MPHCELHYSADLTLDAVAVLALVEQVINNHDPGAEECKGRAYPAERFHRRHLKVSVSLLPKPHRDDAFTRGLMRDLESQIRAQLQQSCFFSLAVEYSPGTYVTTVHQIDGDPLPRYRDDDAPTGA